MSELCITCGKRPRKKGRRQCGHCAWRAEDPDKARVRRREYKRRLRRAQGAEPMEVKRERAAKRRAEREARRAEWLRANSPKRKPWLQFPDVATRYRCRYRNDPEFAQQERDRAIVYRYTHPEIAAKSDSGVRWQLAAERSDGSVTRRVVRELLAAERCYLCGVELTPANRSIDHRVALSRGGDHTADNLAACCIACNRRKAADERQPTQSQDGTCESSVQPEHSRYFGAA